ncbi:transmembrane protein 144b isoform X2 [Nelusetta ayraudi]|uniref:transmembrane protein 144b isoform X2 n=1 Tax=Nelusetta ayraudi TaxID=303726 RepID=UPI003F728A34
MFKTTNLQLLIFVVPLMLSCGSSGHVAERGDQSREHVGVSKLETFASALNSTNLTQLAYGIAANVAAVLLYGTNFVPVKRIELGDGMFYQWVTCAAIWIIAMVGDLIMKSPKFHPFAMIGGVIWATGNLTTVPIIKALGLGRGLLIWGSSSVMMGWASSRFSWFGIAAAEVSGPLLNYCGAALCLLSVLILLFVRSDVELHPNSESIPLLIEGRINSGSYGPAATETWMDAIGPKTRRVIGCLLAVLSGLLYGSSAVPVLYIMNHSSCLDSVFFGASLYNLDYVYAQCCGIFVTSTIYFAFYCAAMNNRPRIFSRAILPGLFSGVMWALATYCWFLASDFLGSVITFPTICAGYGVVAAMWGSLVFKEIRVRMV